MNRQEITESQTVDLAEAFEVIMRAKMHEIQKNALKEQIRLLKEADALPDKPPGYWEALEQELDAAQQPQPLRVPEWKGKKRGMCECCKWEPKWISNTDICFHCWDVVAPLVVAALEEQG